MNTPPASWIKSQLRLKSTRQLLEVFLKVMTEQRPCCLHTAIMSLWTHPDVVAFEWEHKFLSLQIHNLRMRLNCAYWAHSPEIFPVRSDNIVNDIGMLRIKSLIQLIELAIKLPKEYCGDCY